ncbi:MAG TPA: BT_3928 family protein [Puia sp.]|uniref:BT_3928 family protein n=1 Tax=Puia sp. TaxID=2045100 RepID=UPI002CF2CE38|nr:BT_3928 family protein [Puia sp.]HVU96175.1 BT_3928 family protein [Puia sp.]
MKLLIAIARTLVGVLFIFSGLVKANDPLGLSYKMQEFFEVWNIHRLDHFTLGFSIVMIVFEIVAGVAILLGWRMRLFSWLLLLLIIFFTFLTGYAYLSGKVRECGCFGDCIPLTAGQSFTKDLVLLLLILFLFAVRDRIKPVLAPVGSAAVLILATILSVAFQWHVLVHLPVVDCLPYRAHNNILDKMKPPPGAIPDSTVITMIYEKGGKQIEFDASNFPADFNDSYHFVKRYDKLVRKGNAEAAIKDFVLLTGAGTDTTQAVLEAKGYKLLVFMKDMDYVPRSREGLGVLLAMARSKGVPVYLVTGDYDELSGWTRGIGIDSAVTLLKCDATAIKTAARSQDKPTIYLLKNATILNKWSYADYGATLPAVAELPNSANP